MDILIFRWNKIQIAHLNPIAMACFTLTCSFIIILTTQGLQSWKRVLQISPSKSRRIDSFLEDKIWKDNITTLKNWVQEGKVHNFTILTKLFISMITVVLLYSWIFSPLIQSTILYYTVVTVIFRFFHTVFQIIYLKTVSSGTSHMNSGLQSVHLWSLIFTFLF